jgi:predicted helicase
MNELRQLLETYRQTAQSEREKGTYFEELTITYFKYEASYKDLYSDVWTYAEWAKSQGLIAKDTGIDLVAKTAGTNEYHAIQCKFYDEGHRIRKGDIDSFFTASGQKPFTHRIIVSTTNDWSENAELSLIGQQPSVSKIDLHDLENSQIEWSDFKPSEPPPLKKKYEPRPHQRSAIEDVKKGFSTADRGKLIMACGTGKTYVALKIAEEQAGQGGKVLFLVPSLSLLSQTLTEWTQQSITPLHSFAVCSDSEVGKKRKKNEVDVDIVQTLAHELRYPATTDSKRLSEEFAKRYDSHHMNVIFSTYHSIDVISQAQKAHDLPDFDIIICDEAHRTTGATFEDESESNFVKVHNADFINSDKRLYMTATPRIYADSAKATAVQDSVALCSMDDEDLFGEELHIITFSEAVRLDLLTDYKVIVLTIDEGHVSSRLQNLLKDENNQLKVDDAARIVGCWKALSKQGIEDELDDAGPMRRAVAFAQVIDPKPGGKYHKVSSRQIANMFQEVVEAYQEQEDVEDQLVCEARHVDGTMNATEKESHLTWLKEGSNSEACHILTNVRCLSEGVDVPSLDAVLFLTPRNSPVDVVQSVGRVMRKADGKQRGYVVLPVVIPAGMEPHEALNDNKVYKVVWDVLQALRSHDDRFDAMINKLDLIGKDNKKMEVIAITDKVQKKAKKSGSGKSGRGQYSIAKETPPTFGPQQAELQFNVGELERALYAKVVKKCGNRNYWDEWAADIAKIAQTHITRITTIVTNPENKREVDAFQEFAGELRDDLNDSITDDEIIEMLAQHLITKPVFDALFADYSFASHNPVSIAMQNVLDILHEHHLEKEADTLEKFYASVRMRADGIENAQGKQKIVVELYDKFFRNAFPRMTERLGIVYTPVEVVDFIIHSVNELLQSEFGQDLGSDGVHILDPFTGTGTFITRLLQSGLIPQEKLAHKYKNEIHANEIVLLAYYIAAINIEAVYHGLVGGDYEPFNGICLTDTFQLYEKDDMISNLLVDNSDRRNRQKELDIRVIIGNPPYSAGQESANDDNQNVAYPELDSSIRDTYAKYSTMTSVKNLYDSYIRAIRWASDRVGDSGIVGFVTNAGFLEANTADGLRKCLAEEFSSIYVFHLRGNQRTSGEQSRQEGGKIFGSGSRAPIAISMLIKNPDASEHGKIYWHDIGDYLSREDKLSIIEDFGSVNGISSRMGWTEVVPDAHFDWVNQRDASFDQFIKLGDKRDKTATTLFTNYSLGLGTNRDAWCYNFSKVRLSSNMQSTIDFYNSEVERHEEALPEELKGFLQTDPARIGWSSSLIPKVAKHIRGTYVEGNIVEGLYRPFQKQWVYFDGMFNHRVGQMPQLFGDGRCENRIIQVNSKYPGTGQLALMSDTISDLHCNGDSQCFPLYVYSKANDSGPGDLFQELLSETSEEGEDRYIPSEGISDEGYNSFVESYQGQSISREDVFYYTYGVLHSREYLLLYTDNLTKELPRIPAVKTYQGFQAFTKAGRDLAELHVKYDQQESYPLSLETQGKHLDSLKPEHFSSHQDEVRQSEERRRQERSRQDNCHLQRVHHDQRYSSRGIRVCRQWKTRP